MHVSSDRFDLSPATQRRVELFKQYLWYNQEVCNHCFARVREVEQNEHAHRLSESSLRNLPAQYHGRTDLGSQEFTPWPEAENSRYGKTFCLNCNSDLTAAHHQLPLDEMKPIAVNINDYVREHTPLSLDHTRFGRELGALKSRRDLQGKETQMFAVAFARALESQTLATQDETTDAASV